MEVLYAQNCMEVKQREKELLTDFPLDFMRSQQANQFYNTEQCCCGVCNKLQAYKFSSSREQSTSLWNTLLFRKSKAC